MNQQEPHYSYFAPKNFWWILAGCWLVMTIILGLSSNWVFHTVLPNSSGNNMEGLIYAGIYAFVLLSIFGITWIPLNKRFPLHIKRNVIVHIGVQVFNSLSGFYVGNLIKTGVHNAFFYNEFGGEEQQIGFVLIALISLIGILFINGFFYTLSYINRSKELEKRQTESELIALRAQINPHFLFNSLNSIAALVKISPEQAEEVTQDLADLFRYTLRSSEKAAVTLDEELKLIDLYLSIEKTRFKDRLTVNYEIQDGLHNAMVPSMLLQPLVENAIKHGVSKKEGNHELGVHISHNDGFIDIAVTDSGHGFPHKNLSKILELGTGLSNIFQRLQLQYGGSIGGAILDNGIRIRFPHQQESQATQQASKSTALKFTARESYSG